MTFSSRKNDSDLENLNQAKPVKKAEEVAGSEKAAPSTNPRGVLSLQKMVGNRALQRWIQTKLMVGPVGDRYEQEADRVAEQVVSSAESTPASMQREGTEEEEIQTSRAAASITPLQRQEEEEELQMKPLQRQEEEEELQMKPIQRQEEEEELQMKPLQRQEEEEELQMKPLQRQEEEEELQMKPVQRQEEEEEVQAKLAGNTASIEASSGLENRLSSSKGQGSPLPAEVQRFMEPRFGSSFSGVRVHTGGEAVQMNRDLKARAFTHGKDIFMGQGQYNPDSSEGKRLLAHELTHVIQQTGSEQKEQADER
jgi:hypothetical protein